MTVSEWGQIAAGTATTLLLLAAAVSDLARYRISNRIVLAVIAAFLVSAAFDASLHDFAWALLAALIMFMIGAALFAMHLFGGGDVKLIAAMALWTGVGDLLRFLLVMTAAGGLLGVAWMIKRRRQLALSTVPSEPTSPGEQPAAPAATVVNRIPYGVAIAVAGLHFFATSSHSPFAPLWSWLL